MAEDGSREILALEGASPTGEQAVALLRSSGSEVTLLASAEALYATLGRRHYDAVVLELDGPEHEALARVRRLRALAPRTAQLVLVAPENHQLAVRALKEGADDYVLAPLDGFDLSMRLSRTLERYELSGRVAQFHEELAKDHDHKRPIVHSAAMKKVHQQVERVAPLKTTVLIVGESGVGKELVARSVHFGSPRRERPFVALNCAAIPSSLIESELFGHERGSFTGAHARSLGKFELADRGTLFLDEIGEMDPGTQAKLLRVLEQKEFMRVGGDQSIGVDVRLIAATNADLDERVTTGRFRRDLYYRLKVVTIPVPPLRERRADIPRLAETFLDELSRAHALPRKSLTPSASSALKEHDWPGNVRELKNMIESLLVSSPGDVIRREDLPATLRRGVRASGRLEPVAGMTLAEMERELIRKTLEATGGNRTHSAAALGIGVRTLQRKIHSYGIEIPSTRRRPRLARTDGTS